MAGLVLGIHVHARPGLEPAEELRAPRRLRLLVQTAPGRYGDSPGMGYVLQEGAAEPRADSIAIPGTTLVLRRGEPVAITVVNRLSEPTTVHWHGIELESFPDGVPGWSGMPGRTLPAIAPADSFAERFDSQRDEWLWALNEKGCRPTPKSTPPCRPHGWMPGTRRTPGRARC